MENDITIRFNGRLYKKEAGLWFVDSRKRWRPVYDRDRLEVLRQLEKHEVIDEEMEAATRRLDRKV